MPNFIPGIQLSEAFYWEAVRPVLDGQFPNLRHAAALIGYGSDVIGFDTPTSRDHMWGPRLILFLEPDDHQARAKHVHEALRQRLPVSFRGYSTHFGRPDGEGVRLLTPIEKGPVEHLVMIHTLEEFWQSEIGHTPFQDPTPAAWLTFAGHKLLSLTAGKVFHDDLELEAIRRRFAWYPHEVWLYVLAAQWAIIGQEEAFIGRTAQTGDEIGSRILAARTVEKLMRLCFLMERRYAPYSKWFGTAFRQLDCAARLLPHLEGVLAASSYAEREQHLAPAYQQAAEMHNALGITPPVEPRLRTYSGWHKHFAGQTVTPEEDTRPFQVLFAPRFVEALQAQIHDPAVLALRPVHGSVNQFMADSSDALQNVSFTRGLEDDLFAEA